MTISRVVVRMPYFTNIPEDVVTNTFHYETVTTPTPTQLEAMAVGVTLFYNQPTGTVGIGNYYSSMLSRGSGVCEIDIYDLDTSEPRVPLESYTFTLPAANGTPSVPTEVSVCLSYRAQFVSGSSNARRRGRIYLGPFNSGAIANGTASSFPSPNSTMITDILDAAEDHLYTGPQAVGAVWCVFSPTDNIGRAIIECWIDNAFDTQRRRGNQPTSRTVRPVGS